MSIFFLSLELYKAKYFILIWNRFIGILILQIWSCHRFLELIIALINEKALPIYTRIFLFKIIVL